MGAAEFVGMIAVSDSLDVWLGTLARFEADDVNSMFEEVLVVDVGMVVACEELVVVRPVVTELGSAVVILK